MKTALLSLLLTVLGCSFSTAFADDPHFSREAERLDRILGRQLIRDHLNQIPIQLSEFIERKLRVPTDQEVLDHGWQQSWNDPFVKFMIYEGLSPRAREGSKIRKALSAEVLLEKLKYRETHGGLSEEDQILRARVMRFLKPFTGFIEFLNNEANGGPQTNSGRKVIRIWRHFPATLASRASYRDGLKFVTAAIKEYNAERLLYPHCQESLTRETQPPPL